MLDGVQHAGLMRVVGSLTQERSSVRHETAPADPFTADSVELSDAARSADRDEPPIRDSLVQRVRAEVRSGDYVTDDKLNVVVDRLHRAIFGR